MTKDDILSMAREAEHLLINEYYTNGTVMGFSFSQLERFAALVAEKEREAWVKKTPTTVTTGHCKEKAKPGGCQLHNIQCGFPACDRKE